MWPFVPHCFFIQSNLRWGLSKREVTVLVRQRFQNFSGASKACVGFRESTAFFGLTSTAARNFGLSSFESGIDSIAQILFARICVLRRT